MKAIETKYKGYRFRSRLEARWAVFFDRLLIDWHYEPEGYELPSGAYLPDFWLPQVQMFAEVKPGPFGESEMAKCRELAESTMHPVLMLEGPPALRSYWAYDFFFEPDGEKCQESDLCDFVLYEGHQYWIHEGRFYSHTGAMYPDYSLEDYDRLGTPAVEAARSARFDHRESGK